MDSFKSNSPSGLFITKVLKPGDTDGNLPEFDEAKLKESERLTQNEVYEIMLKDEVFKHENIPVVYSCFPLPVKLR